MILDELRLVDADDLCAAAEATLRAHIDEVLELLQPDTWGNSDVELQPVATWGQVPQLEALRTAAFPAVAITSPGTTTPPVRHGTGKWTATWRVDVGVYDIGGDYNQTSRRARRWAGVVRATLLAHPTLGGVANATTWVGDNHRPITDPRVGRTLAGSVASFDVRAVNVIDIEKPAPVTTVPPPRVTVRPQE